MLNIRRGGMGVEKKGGREEGDEWEEKEMEWREGKEKEENHHDLKF